MSNRKKSRDEQQRGDPPPRRAGLRDDELDPRERPNNPVDHHAAGTSGGGSSAGGLAGSNEGDGSPDDAELELEEAFGSGIHYDGGDSDEGGPPYAGLTGGAVGGTPAEKRSKGGKTGRGIAPGTSNRGDSTIGGEPRKSAD
jgi:hypothetical protein